ncbi:MAG: sulfotransferase domain-containing protein [Paracoccaceae bacterium]
MPRKSIVWLASYPKSGNTWARIFLANYLFGRTTPMPINQVHRLGMGDSIEKMYRMVAKGPFDVADYRQSLALRGRVLAGIVNNDADVNFVKTHNHRAKAFGVGLIPPALTRSAIYILRNPLDMVLSYARQYGHTPEFAAAAIGRPDNSIAGANGTVTQYVGAWSAHVTSWARCRDFPVLVLRYEDMQADPEAAFSRVLEHIGVPPDPQRVARAVRFSSFDELRRQEEATGFVERSPNSERFFHAGRSGQWRDELAPEAAERIRKDHGRVMREYGYLDG